MKEVARVSVAKNVLLFLYIFFKQDVAGLLFCSPDGFWSGWINLQLNEKLN